MTGQANSYVYALDIGTRKVAGIVLDKRKKPWQIRAACIIEQEPGAMEDGQIHDVRKVSQVIRQVTDDLSQQTGLELTQAAVAAAGRSLHTRVGQASRAVSPLTTISDELVHALELEAVLAAREDLGRTARVGGISTGNPYMFIAYSATRYTLDGSRIASLIGQRGSRADVEVIATFLPRVVIDSLTNALDGAGLKMASLTLEPIAALNVAIPPSMRSLNLALADIGAGTSDIAITKDQTVVAYGMVPIAGDEITAALTSHYLLDFTEGERVKRLLIHQEEIEFTDVLGFSATLPSQEIQKTIRPAVENLATQIASEILNLNEGTSPQAVICVGGGASTPGLREALAAQLGLPQTRVAVRGRDIVRDIIGAEDKLSGPASITPLGIALLAGTSNLSPFIDISLNGQTYKLLKSATRTVKEALIGAGIGLSRLLGPPGEPLSVRINGQMRVFPGQPGTPAEITKNGKPCSLDEPIEPGDQLWISEPTAGQPARLTIEQAIASRSPQIIVAVNGKETSIHPLVLRNGKPASLTVELKDGDELQVTSFSTVAEVLELLRKQHSLQTKQIRFTINGTPFTHNVSSVDVAVNGVLATDQTPLNDGDRVDIWERRSGFPTVGDILREHGISQHATASITVAVNDEPITLGHKTPPTLLVNGRPAGLDHTIRDGDHISVLKSSDEDRTFIVSDVLRYHNPAEQRRSGKSLYITVNAEPAGFTTPIKNGDKIHFEWR